MNTEKISETFCFLVFIILDDEQNPDPSDSNKIFSLSSGYKRWEDDIFPILQLTKTNSVAFSLQANDTDRATATCRRNLVPTFVDRGVSRGQRGGSPTVVNLSFLDRSRYFSFK
jgi:hypothetical protein